MQIGGSDQWGNITAGTDLIRRLLGREEDGSGREPPACFGLTFPLLVRGRRERGGTGRRAVDSLSFPLLLMGEGRGAAGLACRCS